MSKVKIPLRQLVTEITSKPVEDIMIEVEYEGKNLVLDQRALDALMTVDSTGRPHTTLDTSGRMTEVSAATIQQNTAYTTAGAWVSNCNLVGVPVSYTGLSIYNHVFKKVVTLVAADGGGLVAATPLVTGPAGYYPVIDGLLLWSTVADTFTANFTPTGGAVVGPAALSYTTVASVVNTATEKGLWYNLTDASVINIDISGATVGMVIHVVVFYHYET